MKINIFIVIIFSFLLLGCEKEKIKPREINYDKFQWSITIPKNFEPVSKEDWARQQNRGIKAIEDAYGEEIDNLAKIIFVFKHGKLNIFEANYQPFDENIDGSHAESFDNVNEVLIETFRSQIPDIKVKKQRSVKIIDGLAFQACRIELTYPNNVLFNCEMYSHLFNKEELTVNIMFTDNGVGKEMRESLFSSKFKK